MNTPLQLPPKTCSIDRLITLEADIQLVLAGRKTATRRNGRYADPGESTAFHGRRLVVIDVYRQKVGELSDDDAQSEGYESVEAYNQHILRLHPGMPWLPHMNMWVHDFRLE
ncbi:ASCH domain-containing protein [Paenibacillus soyae]|uniref:ASCH domain-containing protein n=1 Tax=Paenibacillus soyae TaxID=2969249 RepID=A0A9X2MW03_9BACL|nr:ASCH domain-containing protein [Paenibacillus soyae]MCR2807445.1 ASCH domain-containing protein [Paenibacillus soyae]